MSTGMLLTYKRSAPSRRGPEIQYSSPVLISRVRFESAPFQALKFFLTVAKGASPLVVKDTSNPGWTDQSLGFRFDIHAPRSFNNFYTVPHILPTPSLTSY